MKTSGGGNEWRGEKEKHKMANGDPKFFNFVFEVKSIVSQEAFLSNGGQYLLQWNRVGYNL